MSRPAPGHDDGLEEIEEIKGEILSLLSDELDVHDPEMEAHRTAMQRESNEIIDAVVRKHSKTLIWGTSGFFFVFGFLGAVAGISSRKKVDLGAGGLRAGVLAFTGGTVLCAAVSGLIAFITSKALNVHSIEEFGNVVRERRKQKQGMPAVAADQYLPVERAQINPKEVDDITKAFVSIVKDVTHKE